MVLTQEEIPEKLLREKMKKWLMLKEEKADHMLPIIWPFRQSMKELEIAEDVDLTFLNDSVLMELLLLSAKPREFVMDVTEEVLDLKKRVSELESRVGKKRRPTKVDFVYELFKDELEREHFGKIVAIDTDLEEIVGIGDTILKAYNDAKEKTGKEEFDFKRVGYRYIHKV